MPPPSNKVSFIVALVSQLIAVAQTASFSAHLPSPPVTKPVIQKLEVFRTLGLQEWFPAIFSGMFIGAALGHWLFNRHQFAISRKSLLFFGFVPCAVGRGGVGELPTNEFLQQKKVDVGKPYSKAFQPSWWLQSNCVYLCAYMRICENICMNACM